MSMPKKEALSNAILLAVSDGGVHKTGDIRDRVIHSTPESENGPELDEMMEITRTRLVETGFLDSPASGYYQISQDGREELANRKRPRLPQDDWASRFKATFTQIISALAAAEEQSRIAHDGALDMDDLNEARRVSEKAHREFFQIRAWRRKLEAILSEMEAANAFDPKKGPVLEGTAAKAPINYSASMQPSHLEKQRSDTNMALAGNPIDQNLAQAQARQASPRFMTLLGRTQEVGSWKQVYINVCEAMLLRKPFVVAGFDKDPELNPGSQPNFSYMEARVAPGRKRLSNGLWMTTHENEGDCERASRLVLEKCGYEPSSLIVVT